VTVSDRDKRALALLGVAAVVSGAVYFWPESTTAAIPTVGSIPQAERRLVKLREVAATIPARQKVLEDARKNLADLEKGLLKADTGPQAQALLLQLARKLARAQSPLIDFQQTEIQPIQSMGSDYSEVAASITFVCRIEQLVNLIADLSAQPEMLAPRDLQVRSGDPKQKTLNVRLTVAGLIPRSLAGEQGGGRAR
jgi:hypothetical protein